MAGTIMPNPKFLGFDNNGDPLSGGKLYTYEAGTSTPQDTYSDVNLTTPNTNPVILDTGGRATVFLSNSSYKFVLKDSNDVTIWTQDNISAFSPQNLDIQGTAGEVVTDGAVVYLSDGSGGKTAGKWYLADADNAYSSSTPSIAIVTVGAAANATVSLRLQGSFTYSSALTPGTSYYTSATAGELSATPGTYDRFIGVAEIDGFTLIFAPNPPNVALSPTFATVIATQAFVLNNQTTAGVRLDLESGTLAVREGDDSAYAPMNVGAVTANSTVTIPLGAVGTPSLTFSGDANTGLWSPAADTVAVSTGGTERWRTDSVGRLLIDTATARTFTTLDPLVQIETAGSTYQQLSVTRNSNDTGGASLIFGKSRGTTLNSNTVVADGDSLGSIRFQAADGVDMDSIAAQILVQVDGAPGSNDTPGRLIFSTAADGAATVTERMRINNAGNIGIGMSPSVWPTAGNIDFSGGNLFANGGLTAGSNAYYDTSWKYKNNGYAAFYGQIAGEYHTWQTAPTGTANNALTFTERMRLTNGGNLAIGATAKLYLDGVAGTGDTYLHEAAANRIKIVLGGTEFIDMQSTYMSIPATAKFYLDGGGDTYITESSANTLSFYTAGVTKLILGADTYIAHNTTAAAANAYIDGGDAKFLRSTSSVRYKHDIDTLDADHALFAVMAMRPVTYRGKTDADQRRHIGFIAEEMQEIAPLLCTYDEGGESGTPNYVTYDRVTAYLVAVVQQQQAEIAALKARLN